MQKTLITLEYAKDVLSAGTTSTKEWPLEKGYTYRLMNFSFYAGVDAKFLPVLLMITTPETKYCPLIHGVATPYLNYAVYEYSGSPKPIPAGTLLFKTKTSTAITCYHVFVILEKEELPK